MLKRKNKSVMFILFALFFCIFATGTVSAADAPSANFTANTTNGFAPLTVQFTDTSTGNPTSWNWDFGDNATSTEQNPTHTYTTVGARNVTLSVANSDGSSTLKKTNYITAWNITSPLISYNGITFYVANDAGVKYDMPDGVTTAAQYGGVYPYVANTYYISEGAGGTNPIQISTSSSNQAGQITNTNNQTGSFYIVFSGGITHLDDAILMLAVNGTIPDDFSITITSSGYTYTLPAAATTNPDTTKLTNVTYVTGALNETFYKDDFIYGTQSWRPCNVANNPMYYPGEDMNSPDSQFHIMFIDLNVGAFKYNAAYPAGITSLINNGAITVNYTFNNLQSFAVFGAYGWFSACNWGTGIPQSNYYVQSGYNVMGSVPVAPVANFTATPTSGVEPVDVQFTDNSSNNPTSWAWDFGDGATSTEKNPNHTYTTPGTYTVTLTATNSAGNNTLTQTNLITVNWAAPTASFTSNATSGFAPLDVQFNDGSKGAVTGWLWDFGDGTTSTEQNPTHTYLNSGTYTVTLTVTGPGGNSTVTQTNYISAFNSTAPSVTATPDAGAYNSNQTVTLTSDQPGSSIYYTTDGSDPTDASNPNRTPYTVPIQVLNNTILNFAAVNTGGVWSARYNKTYTILQQDIYVSPTGSDSTGNGTASNPYATIQTGLNNVVSGGTVHLLAGTYTGTGNRAITIAQNVNIVGDNQLNTIIDAQLLSNIFTINSGVTVTITNLTFENGTTTKGGAIYNGGTLNTINCTFINNKATNGLQSGGAICNYGDALNVTGCSFINNTGAGPGGAICDWLGTLYVSNCTFIGNKVTGTGNGGGAINIRITATLINSTFIGNTASRYGGAIQSSGTIPLVSGCTFINNTAAYLGGAIYNSGTITLIENSNFTGNNQTSTATDYGGGAIFNSVTITAINNCVFVNNTAARGGAIFSKGNANTIVNVYYSSFVNNIATLSGWGDAICCYTGVVNATYNWWGTNNSPASQIMATYQPPGTVYYNNWLYMTETVNPTALVNGGTATVTVSFNNIWNGSAVVSIDPASGHIVDGTLVNFSSLLGSFDHATVSTVNGVATCVFTAANLGAGFVNATTNSQTLSTNVTVVGIVNERTNATYTSIQAMIDDVNTLAGDVITFYTGSYTENIVLSKSLIFNASGVVHLIPLDASQPALTITNSGSGSVIQGFIINGSLNSSGVSLDSASNVTLINDTVSGNYVGVKFWNSTNNSLINNTVVGNGWSGICLDTSNANTIYGNTLSGNQEGLFVANSAGNIIFNNTASGNAYTGISIIGGSDNLLQGNLVQGNGVSGILIQGSANNNLTGNTAQNNSWSGICLDGATGNNLIDNNVAYNQEGIFAANSASGNTINFNTVSGNLGNGISLIQGTGNTIDSNNVTSNGVSGVFVQQSGTTEVYGNTIENNSWSGICLDTVTGSSVTGNYVAYNQEGIFMVNSQNNGVSFNQVKNSTYTGISVLSGSDNNTFIGNTASGNGVSGIFVQSSDLNTLQGNTLQNNTWSGVCLDRATNTQAVYNNFENNPEQALAVGGSGNSFDSNYWSDWPYTFARPIDGDNNISDANPQPEPIKGGA
ncbi:NosD domain-containing protein [uncultured Methanobacterium sp.]|uniref:NosD domain-containing protein n=1 Tax=uncultured Methanobacterium sp. TaxID=176306 RepID=UPI002AA695ED|nr:NosD domain-containing protein [uncultured Methanobacterium sp.]